MSCVGSAKQEMAVGETEKLTTAPAGVDTVVVFEENECNKNKRKDLLGLISNIEKSYKIEGMDGSADKCGLNGRADGLMEALFGQIYSSVPFCNYLDIF